MCSKTAIPNFIIIVSESRRTGCGILSGCYVPDAPFVSAKRERPSTAVCTHHFTPMQRAKGEVQRWYAKGTTTKPEVASSSVYSLSILVFVLVCVCILYMWKLLFLRLFDWQTAGTHRLLIS